MPLNHTLGIVIATRNRPREIRQVLQNLQEQTYVPDQIIVVDASDIPLADLDQEFSALPLQVIRAWPPSAAAQRNVGLAALHREIDLVGFMDDDIVLNGDAVETVMRFWESAPDDVGGIFMNMLNIDSHWCQRSDAEANDISVDMPNSTPRGGMRKNRCVKWLGLYDTASGAVAASGWNSAPRPVTEHTPVQWLPTTAVVWRREVFAHGGFDPFFDGYSYLEDLDFSYGVGKHYKLYLIAAAEFKHYPAPGGRVSRFQFGKIEVRNRLYFVKKHGLSLWRCYLGLGIRFFMTLGTAVGRLSRSDLQRAAGNLVGLWRSVVRPSEWNNGSSQKFYETILEKNKEYSEKIIQLGETAVPEEIKETINSENIKSIIDLGCGDGLFIRALKKEFPEIKVTGVDISPRRINELKKAFPQEQFLLKDVCATELEEGTFDMVYSSQVIEHVPDDKLMIDEMYRLLKKDGILFVSSMLKKPWAIYQYRNNGKFVMDPTHVREYRDVKEFLDLFKENFNLMSCWTTKIKRKKFGIMFTIPGFLEVHGIWRKR